MHVLFALQPGGMEFGVIKLVNGLTGRRIASSICSTVPAHPAVKPLVSRDVPVFELRRRAGNDPRLVWDLFRLFRRVRPHIVHTHAWGTLLEGLVAARLARVPAVVHGEHGTLQVRGYQRWLQRTGWASADQVLSVSTKLAERMADRVGYPLERIHTLRNGVDLSRFGRATRDEARRGLGFRTDEFVIGTVGRLVQVKDHATLLETTARLQMQGLEVTLVLAGEGPLRSSLQDRADALGIADRVRFLGHRDDVETVLAAMNVFVLPSRSEGLSNTILEAMATGLPVVATRVGGAEELVIDGVTGVLVAPGSPDALADAISTLLGDDMLRGRMGCAARQRAETDFSLPAMIERYQTMYETLAGRQARSAGVGGDARA